MGVYKNPGLMLKATPRVRFEEEDGVGSGPIREFLLSATKVVDEGIPSSRKTLIFFEGEKDHRVPVHDRSLRLTGAFIAIGRILGHCILHGGIGLHGLCPAVTHYWTMGKDSDVPPPITLQDLPDLDLRELVSQLDVMPKTEHPTPELRCLIEPYLYEAGLDPDNLYGNKQMLIEGLMSYNVIDKRILELDDIAKGMEEVSLHSFLKRFPPMSEVVFPPEKERIILACDMKDLIKFDKREESEGGLQLVDLCCFWTGGDSLPTGQASSLLVKFDTGEGSLPLAETCFFAITIPTVHTEYVEFKRCFNTALKYGAKGFSFT